MIKRLKDVQQREDSYSSRIAAAPLSSFLSIAQALTVADFAGFSRAARALGVNQAAVSRRVRALEERLGVSLFERYPGGVRLTAAGSRFFERTRPAFEEIELAMTCAAAAGRGAEGVIRIGLSTPISEFLYTLLQEFRASHPAVQVDFREAPARRQIAAIMDRSLDLAFVAGISTSLDFDSELLWTQSIFVAMHDAHPLVIGKEIEWTHLYGERFIFGRSESDGELRQIVQQRFVAINPSPEIEVHDIAPGGLLSIVALGWGITLVTEETSQIVYPGVSFRPLADQSDRLMISATWLPENDNPALRRLLSLVRAKAAQQRTSPSPSSAQDRL